MSSGIPSLVISVSSPSAVPAIWMPEAVFPTVALNNPQPTVTESPVLSAAAPHIPDPQVFIPTSLSAPDASPTPQPPTVFTLTVTETLTITISAPSPLVTSQSSRDSATEWQSPNEMEDLSAFNISTISGKQNLEVIQGIPADMAAASAPGSKAISAWGDESGSVIQLFYPAGSANPAQRPVGGAQFYATPLDLTDARSVTLTYSVFFPSEFNWVLGGKMPGLYGGHAGCSGGNEALDCWSTRLMWRKEGKGEMYLYAPKEKQTEELCRDPQSVCDATYGFSIGRGSFAWGAGAWTTVRQTVTLNTPGKQDGCFTLDVNDERVIDRSDVFYRDSISKKGHAPTTTTREGGGGLGDLLGTLLSGLLGRSPQTEGPVPAPTPMGGVVQQGNKAQHPWAIQVTSTSAATPSTSIAQDPQPTAPPSVLADDDGEMVSVESQGEPVGFTGLFFR
ncbi:hypothetical protein C0991_006902 [Blastosporella zonata]|nr:hypothetical protein C0991_006902 [Blastosporella zonata]